MKGLETGSSSGRFVPGIPSAHDLQRVSARLLYVYSHISFCYLNMQVYVPMVCKISFFFVSTLFR